MLMVCASFTVILLVTYLLAQRSEVEKILEVISEQEEKLNLYRRMHRDAIDVATSFFLRSGVTVERELLSIAQLLTHKERTLSEVASFKGIALLHPAARREVLSLLNVSEQSWMIQIETRLSKIAQHFSNLSGSEVPPAIRRRTSDRLQANG